LKLASALKSIPPIGWDTQKFGVATIQFIALKTV